MGKKDKWLKVKNLKKIEEWRADGLSAGEVAANMGISRSTLYKWLEEETDISDAYTRGSACAHEIVENALFKRATGFYKTVKKPKKIKNASGEEEYINIDEEIYIPPDTAAIKYFLSNRDSERWKAESRIEIRAADEDEGVGVVVLPEANKMQNAECKMQN